MTTKTTHTPTPWKVIVLDKEIYINPQRETGEYGLMLKMLTGHSAKQANAAHIVRCVNEREDMLATLNLALATLERVAPAHTHGRFSTVQGTIDVVRRMITRADQEG